MDGANIRKIAILQDDGTIIEILPSGFVNFEVERKFDDFLSPQILVEQNVTLKIQCSANLFKTIKPSKAVIKRIDARRKKEEKAERARKKKEASLAKKDRVLYDEEIDYDIWQ